MTPTPLDTIDDLGRVPAENNDDEPAGAAANDPPGSGSLIGRVKEGSTDWGQTMRESAFFVGVLHSYRLLVEPDTRAALGGQ